MRSIGAGAAGGVGEAIANHIIEGRPPFDMYNLVCLTINIVYQHIIYHENGSKMMLDSYSNIECLREKVVLRTFLI